MPNTAKFDKELADSVVKFAKPYEVRADGKLMGYSIPLQALVEQERQALKDRRASQPAAPASTGAPAAQQQPAQGDAPKPSEAPQAGIQSRAGQSGEGADDLDALWGTLGLSGIRL